MVGSTSGYRMGAGPTIIYRLVLAGIAVGMVVGGQINVLLLSRWTEHQILVFWTSAVRLLLRRARYRHPCYGGRSLHSVVV